MAGVNPLAHYLRLATVEMLDPHALFSTRFYLQTRSISQNAIRWSTSFVRARLRAVRPIRWSTSASTGSRGQTSGWLEQTRWSTTCTRDGARA